MPRRALFSPGSAAFLALAVLLPGAAPAPAGAQERPNLTGTWYFSVEESDDLQETLTARNQELGLIFFGPDEENDDPGTKRLRTTAEKIGELFRAQEAFDLEHTDTLLVWTSRSVEGATLHLRIGRTWTEEIAGLGEVKTKASWDDERMKVERRVEDGPRMKEYYSMSTDRSRLLVDVELQGPRVRGTVHFRRVFTRRRPRSD